MAQPSVLLDTMSQELNRNFTVMKEKADPAPYFLSYEVTEVEYRTVSGTLGTVDASEREQEPRRWTSRCASARPSSTITTACAVGGRWRRIGQFTSGALLTFEDSANSIKRRLWLETDRAYRAAAERLIRIKTNTQVKVAEEDSSGRFFDRAAVGFRSGASQAEVRHGRPGRTRVRKLSARFGNYPSVLTSHVTVSAQTDTRYFVNTEGSRLEYGRGLRARIHFGIRQGRRRHRPELV